MFKERHLFVFVDDLLTLNLILAMGFPKIYGIGETIDIQNILLRDIMNLEVSIRMNKEEK